MSGLLSFLLFGLVFFFMMRMGCGGHVGHGGHGTSGGGDDREPADHGEPAHGHTPGSGSYVDPVCGMTVGRDSGYGKTYRGVEYRFCSRDCLDKFDASPDNYAGRQPSAPMHGGHSS